MKSQHRTSDYVELPHHVSQVDLPFSSIFSIWYSNKLLYTNATHLRPPLKRNVHSMNPEHKRRSKRRYEKYTKKIRKRYNAHYYTVKKKNAIFRYTALSIFSSCLRQEASRALGPCPRAWSNGSLISLLFVDWPMNT